MSEAERLDYERTIAELRTSRDAWREVAQCRLCLPYRLHWCLRHKDTGPEPHQDLPRPK